jgi:hypothetical protein
VKRTILALVGLGAVILTVGSSLALAGPGGPRSETPAATVRQATRQFQNAQAAQAAGYGLFHGCVSGPQEGAMGIHFANGDLVGDGLLDAQRPEALLYELKDGQLRLVGVEYLVLASQWDAAAKGPPTLMGQMFNYVGEPNRYGLPAFYELHVWAWKSNPSGTFADWNPKVRCDEFFGVPPEHH